jgi:hypothetical protein
MNPSASDSELSSDFRVPRRRVTAGVTARVRIPKRGSVNRPESNAGSGVRAGVRIIRIALGRANLQLQDERRRDLSQD